MREPDRNILIDKPAVEMVRVPGDLLSCDKVEIRVILTGLNYWDDGAGKRELRPFGERSCIDYTIDRRCIIDAKDSRAVFYIIREMLLLLARSYLRLEL
jgi:hypothetical protein